MRKIHITESQLKELKKKMDEMNVNGDEALKDANGDANAAIRNINAQATKEGIPSSAPNSVTFSDSALKQTGKAYSLEEGGCITKRQIKEAKLRKLKNESYKITKKDLMANF